jgi:CBS domain-containing protein
MVDARIARVRGFMTSRPDTIPADMPLEAARQRMFDLDVHHLPVVRDGRLVGVLSASDILLAESIRSRGGLRGVITVSEVMHAEPFTCVDDAHLHAVAREMAHRRQDCAVVLDDAHPTRINVVFTTTDALRALSVLAPQERVT